MQIATYGSMVSGSDALANAIGDAANVRRRLDTLTRQAGDGLISDTYAGLGNSATASLTLNQSLGQVETWQANVDAASGRMATTQSALSQISDIASQFFAQTNTLTGLDATAIDTISASARDALRQVAGLLDSKFGDTYVFAGIYGSVPPVPSPDSIISSGMVTSITSAVGQLATNGAAATIASTRATAASNTAGTSPFDPAFSQSAAVLAGLRPIVQTGPGSYQPVGIIASGNADVASSGASTTGSYIRDIMRGLATIGALTSGQASVTGYATLVDDVHTSLGGAITALSGDAGVLGNRQAAMTTASARLADTATALKSRISDSQDVDMATTLSNLSAAQTQLQSSYQLLGALRGLTLAAFLG